MYYKYNALTGVTKEKIISLKKKLLGVGVSLGIIGVMAVPALAVAPASGYCVASSNGCTQSGSQEAGNCAGHGAFGAFSHHTGTWIPADAQEDGGLGHETGPANSGLCGNPQN
jgi:hypothetical protein